MDEVAADPRYKEPFRGWHASIADAECNSPAEVREKYRKGRDGVTGAETLTAALKNYRELDDSVVLTYIKCIVHMVADFHCPAHVRYTDAHNEGKFDVTFFGKPKTLHSVWDSGVIARIHPGWSYERYADYLDNASKREIRRMTEGSYRQWFEDAARDVRPSIDWVAPGDTLGEGVHGKSRTAGRAAAPQGVVPVGRSPQPDFRRVTLSAVPRASTAPSQSDVEANDPSGMTAIFRSSGPSCRTPPHTRPRSCRCAPSSNSPRTVGFAPSVGGVSCVSKSVSST